ncbi:MAG: hypothetical protein WCP32_09335 [Bacteroidota bacterium]
MKDLLFIKLIVRQNGAGAICAFQDVKWNTLAPFSCWKITFFREIIFTFAKTIIQVGTIEKRVIDGASQSS